MNIKVSNKEHLYFIVKVAVTLAIWFLVIYFFTQTEIKKESVAVITMVVFYALFIILFFIFKHIFFIGYIRGNGVRLSEKQFPDVYQVSRSIALSLGINNVPRIYLLQSGGVLNAFATRLLFKNYIVLYSEVFEMAYRDMEVLKFVLAHELGHIYRKHLSRRFWTLPSAVVPFLDSAYSRACEYTCDNVGAAFSENSRNGLLLLAAGSELYNKVNVDEFLATFSEDNTFLTKFVHLFMSHPWLPKRVRNIM